MKIFLQSVCFLSLSLIINAQELIIHKTHETIQRVALCEIDFITFQTSYGIPCPGMPEVLYGSKTYNTVQIGSQCWLKENLDIGAMITGSPSDNGIIEKYCYNDNLSN